MRDIVDIVLAAALLLGTACTTYQKTDPAMLAEPSVTDSEADDKKETKQAGEDATPADQ